MDFFKHKTAYIVGGSSGIGLATAKLLAHKGAEVIIFARRREPLDHALGAIKATNRLMVRGHACQLDAADRDQVQEVMAQAVSSFGPPDLLINCAGRAYPRSFDEVSAHQFEETMRINLYTAWNTIAVLLPYMKTRGGYIVNTSSVAGFIGVYGYTDYCASKFAVYGFSEALRSELKPFGILVSVLCPPDTDTPAMVEENKTKPAETWAISGNVRLMSAESVAAALLSGVRRGKFLIIPGWDGWLTNLVSRLAPGLVRMVMDRQIAGVRHKKQGALTNSGSVL